VRELLRGSQAGETDAPMSDVPLAVLRMRIGQLVDLCHVIAEQHDGHGNRDVSVRLALQYLRQDLGRSDLQLARLEKG
jgi:hypothetical protein